LINYGGWVSWVTAPLLAEGYGGKLHRRRQRRVQSAPVRSPLVGENCTICTRNIVPSIPVNQAYHIIDEIDFDEPSLSNGRRISPGQRRTHGPAVALSASIFRSGSQERGSQFPLEFALWRYFPDWPITSSHTVFHQPH